MSDIISNLEKLSPEELQKVGNLINKFAKRHTDSEKEIDDGPPPRETVRTPRRKVDRQPRQVRRSDDVQESPTQMPRGSQRGHRSPRSPRNQQQENHPKHNKQRRNFGRIEQVQLTGENKFFDLVKRENDYKGDSKIDKKLWKGNKPMPRPQKYEPVEVQCIECHYYFDVNPELIILDEETGLPNYTCNNCVKRR